MTKDELCEAALQELHRIEQGVVTVDMVAGDPLLGDVEYRTSGGWHFVVFSDGGEWDYLHTVTAPSGGQVQVWPEAAETHSEAMKKLLNYHPPGDQTKAIWKFMD